MSHTTIAELVPKTIDSLYILMELSLEDDFLVETEYYL